MTTSRLKVVGFAATLCIVLLLTFNLLREPFRQGRKTQETHDENLDAAIDLYALNCVNCHGPRGEGLNINPALDTRLVRYQERDELAQVIARGRAGTAMVAFGLEDKGILTAPQIDSLVTLIQQGSWGIVEQRIQALNLLPTPMPPIEIQFDVTRLSYPVEVVSQGRTLYMENCSSCHSEGAGRAVTGHSIGRNLSDNQFIQETSDEDLVTFTELGRPVNDPTNVTGYEMPPRGGNPNLTEEELLATIAYLREINNKTIVINEVEAPTIKSTVWNGAGYQWALVVDNLDSPLGITHANDGSGRLFVVEQGGFILIVENGVLNLEPFLDVSSLLPLSVYSGSYSEQGLLGLAFHPNYKENGFFFISYSDRNGDSVLARYQVDPNNPRRADPNSGVTILFVDQPYEDHNGGHIVFGPDGYLYFGLGDGGRPSLPNYNSQDPSQLLGKLLRIDVNAETYTIPPDNPFVNDPAYRPEIWALGMRNPWRFTFDRQTGDMYIGDVGQWRIEEVDFQPGSSRGGENYGWSVLEANEPYLTDETISGGILKMPVFQYYHDVGSSVTGGYVYRGQALPQLQGLYIYGDYISGRVWLLRRTYGDYISGHTWQRDPEDTDRWENILFMETGLVISSFGEDEQGELYLVDYKGAVYRLESAPVPPPTPTPMPTQVPSEAAPTLSTPAPPASTPQGT